MRSRGVILSALVLTAALLWHQPFRARALAVFRLPFTIASSAVRAVLLVPRLPALADENRRLRRQLEADRLELARLREGERQHKADAEVRDAFGISTGIVARVIARSTIPTQHTVILDKGSKHGLNQHTVVMDAEGLVGRVVDVQPDTSVVLLLTDPDCRVAAVLERSRDAGLLVGTSTGRCQLVYLGIDADLKEGDRVVTAGLGGLFPKGLPLGAIARVVRDDVAGSSWAVVEPSARLTRLEDVFCVPALAAMRPEAR